MLKLKSGTLFLLCFILFLAISCTSSSKNASSSSTPETPETPEMSFDKKKVLVLLKPGIRAKALIREFTPYSLVSKGKISRSENRFMFSYDNNAIGPDDLLSKIKESDIVLEASFPEVLKKARVSKMNR